MLQISNLTFAHAQKDIFDQANLIINHPSRIALIGDNGTGKTTLFRLLLKQLSPDDGKIKLHGKIGYLAQADDFDNHNSRPAKTLPTDDQTTRAEATPQSGGEKTHTALTKLFTQDYDVLLLDEPTNHLDIRARENIEQALQNYAGAILLVSHDQKFSQNLQIKNIIHL